MTKPAQPRYRLELQAQPGPVPPHVRLRHLLKVAARTCGLRCLSAVEVKPETTAADRPNDPPHQRRAPGGDGGVTTSGGDGGRIAHD
jgi:hypothetical protein